MTQMRNDKHIGIIVAAGRGERMQADKPKVLLELAGKPVLSYALETFVACPWMDTVIVVAAEEYLGEIRVIAGEAIMVVAGGSERTDSVRAGLRAAGEWLENLTKEPSPCQNYVYIHDGARPFVSQEVLERVKAGVEKCGACVCGVPVKDTIREVAAGDAVLAGTFDRGRLRAMQTPQAFNYDLICEAYDKFEQMRKKESGEQAIGSDGSPMALPTDDAQVVEQMTGHAVSIVDGDYKNIKLTTPEDMIIAEAFVKS